ncbi:MAG TPA: DNA polymerase III subunit gamma and tau [Propionibacteriaceae bacterium]|nr:DNA polymerase III subunit gamma and tau [Propionibacteriaceae bacterium]
MEEVMVDEPHVVEPLDSTQTEVLFGGPQRGDDVVASAASEPLALYRRYRPDTFADVIGQEHVTEPLQRALTNNRVNHAYLFSGPRGCGKTTSARILARALNCVQGPVAEPCGACDSCRDLARGGPGSIDVIEIDAASHGGVDDARDLRERAFFSPVSSRYKIYIVDEAHMVTTAGFNALLKLVEEPPPHVKFIFATTEPDKVIGTIRSRTHHYPFRLVPPRVLNAYLAKLCEAEGIRVEPTVLPLVVRAGGGSVRDSLSVLDQLLGAADQDGVSYRQATALLGYTPDSLLDEFVDAFGAGDAGGVFACVDKVIEVGQDPRRFAEDLLRRLRDLVIVAAVPDALTSGLVDVAADQAERLGTQAASLGAGELTRAAEVIALGLTDMRGTTAPRLHLELMCARVLLPGADVADRGIHARLDRLERRIGMTGLSAEPKATPTVAQQAAAPAAEAPPLPGAVPSPSSGAAESLSRPSPSRAPNSAPASHPVTKEAEAPGGVLTVTEVRRLWPEVLEEVKGKRRFTWILLSQNAHVTEVRHGTLVLTMPNAGARESFAKGGSEDILREALVVVLGADLKIEVTVDPAAGGLQSAAVRTTAPERAAASWDAPPRPATPLASAEQGDADLSPSAGGATTGSTTLDPALPEQARHGIRPTRKGAAASGVDERDAAVHPDDSDLDEGAETHTQLLARHLGAEIIAEEHDGA